jgi:uncharacterized repeat protein (TIGR03803 family)
MQRGFLIAAIILLNCNFVVGQAKYRVLYNFGAGGPTDAINPNAGLVGDEQGNLYGTASGGVNGVGVVFQLSPKKGGGWTENILYNFCSTASCLDGTTPLAGLIRLNGKLYGTTTFGGLGQLGTVFELAPPLTPGGAWTETVLWSFCSLGGPCAYDGIKPTSRLGQDSAGNLYGTAAWGGPFGGGVVFELTPGSGSSWTENILHSFSGSPDGAHPTAGLTFDSLGNLYGATQQGGSGPCQGGCGTVFQLSRLRGGGWIEAIVGNGVGQQVYPTCDLSLDSEGNIYGTTKGSLAPGGVFKLKRAAGWRAESFLFDSKDGAMPLAGVVMKHGAVYGTTYSGGAQNSGTIFQITGTGETVLHDFCSQPNCEDGQGPGSGGLLLADHAGDLFGTTATGGAYNKGVVFAISP